MREGRKEKGVLNRWEQTAPLLGGNGGGQGRAGGRPTGTEQAPPQTWISSCAGRVRRGPRR